VLRVFFPTADQRCLVPLVLPEMVLAVGLVPVLLTSEQLICLGFLAGLHSLENDVRKPALADHLQDVLAIEPKYAKGSERTNCSTDSWRSCPNQVRETVRISDSSLSSELRHTVVLNRMPANQRVVDLRCVGSCSPRISSLRHNELLTRARPTTCLTREDVSETCDIYYYCTIIYDIAVRSSSYNNYKSFFDNLPER
jgi:hypothetical protein